MSETWKPVVDWTDYEVSDQGRVRSLDTVIVDRLGRSRRHQGRVKKLTPGKRGYLMVGLGHATVIPVHGIVLAAFIGPRPDGLVARHMNGRHHDNRLENLRWGTYSENEYDQVRHGTHHLARRELCPRGHPLEGGNLVPADLHRTGYRRCLACSRGRNYTNHWHRPHRPDLLQVVSDAYYEEIAGNGIGALLALGITPRRRVA